MKKSTQIQILEEQNAHLQEEIKWLTIEKASLNERIENQKSRMESNTYASLFFGVATLIIGVYIWLHF